MEYKNCKHAKVTEIKLEDIQKIIKKLKEETGYVIKKVTFPKNMDNLTRCKIIWNLRVGRFI